MKTGHHQTSNAAMCTAPYIEKNQSCSRENGTKVGHMILRNTYILFQSTKSTYEAVLGQLRSSFTCAFADSRTRTSHGAGLKISRRLLHRDHVNFYAGRSQQGSKILLASRAYTSKRQPVDPSILSYLASKFLQKK